MRVSTCLAIYPYIFMFVEMGGAKEAEGRRDVPQAPRFLPPGWVSLAQVELGCDTPGVSSQASGLAQPLSRGLCT